jgi:hypothetical protein
MEFRDLGVPGQNGHLDVVPVEWRRVYYKGEGDGFPQVWAMARLVCPGCPWFVLAPKVLQLCTKHLVLVLCRSVWVNKACHIFLVPSRSSNTPLYPSIVLRARERGPTPCPFAIFNLRLTFEFRKELGLCHLMTYINLLDQWWNRHRFQIDLDKQTCTQMHLIMKRFRMYSPTIIHWMLRNTYY